MTVRRNGVGVGIGTADAVTPSAASGLATVSDILVLFSPLVVTISLAEAASDHREHSKK